MTTPRATLHILCGKIGAGKSTLAGRLAQAPNTVFLSEDHLLANLYPGEIVTLDDYVRSAVRLRKAIGPHVRNLLREGVSVVLDFQANTPSTRAWMRGLFEEAEAHHQLHWLCTSDETCRARLHQRNAAGTHEYQVSDADFDLFNSRIVPPGDEEGFNIVRHE